MKHLFSQLIDKASPIIKSEPIHIHLPKETFTEHKEILQTVTTKIQSHLLNFTEDDSLTTSSMRIETGLGLINFDIPRLMKEFEASALTEYADER